MAHTILYGITIFWLLFSAGFALIAKWSKVHFIVEIVLKLTAIAAVVWVILELLKIQY